MTTKTQEKPKVIPIEKQIAAVMQAIPLLVKILPMLTDAGRGKLEDSEMIEGVQASVKTLRMVKDNEVDIRDLLKKKNKK